MPVAINGSGTITGVSVGGLPDGIVDTDMLAAGAVTAPKRGAGAILQVVQTEKTDSFSFAPSSTPEFGTVCSATITPSSTSSKILIMYSLNARSAGTNQGHGTRVLRGSTAIGIGATNGSRTRVGMGTFFNSASYRHRCISQVILDSPSTTSATTYNLQIGGETSATYYVNAGESDSSAYQQSATHLTLLEVAG